MSPDPDRTTPVVTAALPHRAAALALAFGCAALLRVAAAQGDSGAYAIALEHGTAPDSAPALTISGRWPTQCTPTFQSATLNGANLRVDARAMLSLCTRTPTAYSIEVDPAAALGRGMLPSGVYRVSYYAADGTQGAPKLQAFALVDSNAKPAAFTPETGFWWTVGGARPASARNVFSLELQGSQLSAALMTYDRDGRGNWQFGTAPLNGRIAHVPLLQLAGGSDPFSAASATPRGEAGLVLDLEFQTSSRATAWLSRAGGGEAAPLELQQFNLMRLPFASATDGSAWQGDWIFVADSDAIAPLRMHFDRRVALDADRFRLVDDANGAMLDCVLDARNPEQPPGACVLHGNNASELGRFTAVAIARMDGLRADGTAVHLLRLSP